MSIERSVDPTRVIEGATSVSDTITRTCIGAAAMAVVTACVAAATGRVDWALPILGGAVWGMLNVYLLYRLSAYLRPDRPSIGTRAVFEFILKFPVLYGLAGWGLIGRPASVVMAFAVGFGIVLFTILLRALGAIWFGSRPMIGSQAGGSPAGVPAMEGFDRAS